MIAQRTYVEFQVVTWGEPSDDGTEMYEVIVQGRLLRADGYDLLMQALADHAALRDRFQAT